MNGQMSPTDQAMLDYFLEMGSLAPEQEQLQRQRAMAQQLRGMAAPAEGQMVGRTYVRSSPLQNLASVAGAGLGAYTDAQANTAATNLMGKRQSALKRMQAKYGGGGLGTVDAMADPRTLGEL